MHWTKKGRIIEKSPGNFTHASHPTAIAIDGNTFLVAFCGRDRHQHSHIFLVKAIFDKGVISIVDDPVLAMKPGEPGTFDCDGLLTCNFVFDEDNLYLYYCGWQNLPNGMWHCDTGRLKVDPENMTLTREFDGPILGRRADIPLYAVATVVQKQSCKDWVSWYNRGISWKNDNGTWIPKYGIHFAYSSDGLNWVCESDLIIPFSDDGEHSFGRPTVLKDNDKYFMWFAARGGGGDPRYRIGFASSFNGRQWIRRDDLSGITVSDEGWDSDAVCYPFVINHEDTLYLLYNGNNYGITGFGYATACPSLLAQLHKDSNE